MNPDHVKFYQDKPKRTTNLDSCYRIESKTRQLPFVVAHEVDNRSNGSTEKEVTYANLIEQAMKDPSERSMFGADDNLESDENAATREFYVFHDLEHFLSMRDQYPHSHEIIRCPSRTEFVKDMSRKIYQDDLARGRLIFDFDLKKPMTGLESTATDDPSTFVPVNFKELIEGLIILTFSSYYSGVDVRRLVFVWQVSRSSEKFSMHLIVKNAYFSEFWVKQMRIFYILFKRVSEINNFGHLMEAVDFQIPRRNATFRMIGSSKIGGSYLEIDCCNSNGVNLLDNGEELDIYDCLVGIYSAGHLKAEQTISLDNVNYIEVENTVSNSLEMEMGGELTNAETARERAFRRTLSKNISLLDENKPTVDLNDVDIEKAVEMFEEFNDGSFSIRDQVGNIINLNRTRKSACKISGQIHDRENAYLKMRDDGHLIFVCRRGCKKGSFYGLDLGIYRKIKKERGILRISPETMAIAQEAKTIMDTRNMPVSNAGNGVSYAKAKSSARRVQMGIDLVQVPEYLKNPRSKVILTVL